MVIKIIKKIIDEKKKKEAIELTYLWELNPPEWIFLKKTAKGFSRSDDKYNIARRDTMRNETTKITAFDNEILVENNEGKVWILDHQIDLFFDVEGFEAFNSLEEICEEDKQNETFAKRLTCHIEQFIYI